MKGPKESKRALPSPGDHMYKGKYSDQQTTGNRYKGKSYGRHEANSLNNYQNFLYNRALFGLAVYSQEEIKEMHWDKRKRIIKVHKRAQAILNLWKQEIIVALSNKFFTDLFPRMDITKQLVGDKNPTDPNYVNNMSFKSLRITKDAVISRLIAGGVLPPNFKELKPQQLVSQEETL